MVYFHIQSWQKHTNGYTNGEDILKEAEGDVMPKDSYHPNNNGFTNNEYFPTYQEARKRFDFILASYYQLSLKNINIKRHDEVTGERTYYNG